MKIEKINNFEIQNLDIKDKEVLKTSDKCPPGFHYGVHLVAGGRGYGKTTFVLNLLLEQYKAGAFNNIYIISPNIETDKKTMYILDKIQVDKKIYNDLTNEIVKEIRDDLDEKISNYNKDLEEIKILKQIAKYKNPSKIPAELIEELSKIDFKDEEYYKNVKKPLSVLYIDDMLGNKIMTHPSSSLSKLVSINRHKFLTCFISLQDMKSISPRIRKCASHYIIAPSPNIDYLKALHAEICGVIHTFEDFQNLIKETNKIPYQFIIIYINGPYSKVFINFNRLVTF
jgi:hypothetical protein